MLFCTRSIDQKQFFRMNEIRMKYFNWILILFFACSWHGFPSFVAATAHSALTYVAHLIGCVSGKTTTVYRYYWWAVKRAAHVPMILLAQALSYAVHLCNLHPIQCVYSDAENVQWVFFYSDLFGCV